MIKKWCLEHGEQSPKHKSAAVRYIDDGATGLTITFAEHGGKPVVRIQNEGSEHVGRYVLETDQVFFVTLRERKPLEIDYPDSTLPTESDTCKLDIKCERHAGDTDLRLHPTGLEHAPFKCIHANRNILICDACAQLTWESSQENIRCAYCKELGHVTDTCPKYAQDHPRG